MQLWWWRALAAGGALLALAAAGPACDSLHNRSVARQPAQEVVVAWRGAAALAAAALLRAELLARGFPPADVRLASYTNTTCELVDKHSWLVAPAVRLEDICAHGPQRVLAVWSDATRGPAESSDATRGPAESSDATRGPAESSDATRVRALSEGVLLVAARPVYLALSDFKPTASDLSAVLAASEPEEEACRRAQPLIQPGHNMPWAVLALYNDTDLPLYANLTTEVATYIYYKVLQPRNLFIDYQWIYIDPAGNDEPLSRWIYKWRNAGKLPSLLGIAVPGEMARPEGAGEVRVLPYSVEADADTLQRLAAACRWRRVAALLAAGEPCPAPRGLAVRCYALPAESADMDAALAAARALDVRVWYVRGDARATEAVLAHAAARGLTREAKHVWLVRAAAAGARGTWPLRLGRRRRGGAGGRPDLAARVAALWPGRAWPPHAVSLADAMLALAEELLRRHGHDTHEFPGIKDDSIKDFDASPMNIKDFRIYIDEWSEDTGAWRNGERPLADGQCPIDLLSDGLAACATPAGDPFDPLCLDPLAGTALLLAAAMRAAWALAARRWRARRQRRLRREHFRAVLARYYGAFAALEPHWLDRGTLELRALLGEGSFGRVHLGVLAGRPPLPVAVKELRAGAAPAAEAEFMREASTLARLRHEHIVRFVGVCAADGPPLLLMEHAFHGDLRRYLRARRHLAEGATGAGGGAEAEAVAPVALTRLAREAAAALAHLAASGLVHRDVRAANCLVDARRSLKLADFGMARAVGTSDGEYACRRNALFPVLWMAPETLARGVSTPASDVWALGVLALELVTLGARPWGALAPAVVVRAVKGGARPPLPPDASGGLRALAAACWRREAGARPAAAALAAWLARRPRALRPALRPPLAAVDVDADSGLGEPSPPDADADSL